MKLESIPKIEVKEAPEGVEYLSGERRAICKYITVRKSLGQNI